MRQKPLAFILMPFVFAIAALAFPAQIMLLYGHGPAEWPVIFSKLTWLNWLVMATLIACTVLVAQASATLRYALPGLLGLVAMNNFLVGLVATDYSALTANLGTLGFALLCMPLAQTKIREMILHPERQWWRASARKLVHVPVEMNGVHSLQVSGQTYDLSMTGLFIPMQRPISVMEREQLLHLQLNLGAVAKFKCDARIVRQTEARGQYPAGLGIQFVDLSRRQRKELKKYLERK